MITDDKMARKLFSMWICSLKAKNDPQFEIKKQTIIEIMNVFGVEEMEGFENELENLWKKHYAPAAPNPWVF